MKDKVVTSAAALGEPGVGDFLLAFVAANERALGNALLDLLEESKRYAAVLDATANPIRRQELIKVSRIDSTNISKVTGPLTRTGWLKAGAEPSGLVYRRSSVIDVLLRDRTISQWRRDWAHKVGRGR